jgi:hypothetical protein
MGHLQGYATALPRKSSYGTSLLVQAMHDFPDAEGLQWRAPEALHNVLAFGEDADLRRCRCRADDARTIVG